MRLKTRYTQRLPTAPGLVLDIPMFEGSGSKVLDLSGKGNHGTIHNAAWTRDENGVAMSFNGTNAYIDCGNDPSLNITDAITIEMWVKFNVLPISRGIVGKMSAGGDVNSWMLYAHSDSKVSLFIYDGGVAKYTPKSPDAVVIDTWYYLVGTYDGIILRMYVNGIEVETSSYTGDIDATSSYVSIGKIVSGNLINGTIDEVRIYNRALSAEQIKRRYEQTKRDYVRAS